MTETNQYNLEERTYQFAKEVSIYSKLIPRNSTNFEYINQLIRSSGSIGANYIEANESLSKRDFVMRIKICRKEAKESAYWLRLIIETNPESTADKGWLLHRESIELKKIFCFVAQP